MILITKTSDQTRQRGHALCVFRGVWCVFHWPRLFGFSFHWPTLFGFEMLSHSLFLSFSFLSQLQKERLHGVVAVGFVCVSCVSMCLSCVCVFF